MFWLFLSHLSALAFQAAAEPGNVKDGRPLGGPGQEIRLQNDGLHKSDYIAR